MKIGLQVYSVRDALAEDYAGTMRQIKAMGYAGVELFGNAPTAPEVKTLLNTLRLEVIGHHFGLSDLEKDFAACAARAKEIGTDNIICAWSMPTPEQPWEAILESLTSIAAKAKAINMNFLYHNHDHEINQYLGQQRVLDAILEICNGEIDIAWVHAGGANVQDYLEQHANKTQLLHLKDVKTNGDKWETVELGQGSVPLLECLVQAKKTQSPWLIIEQDFSPNPMQSAARNYSWLKERMLA